MLFVWQELAQTVSKRIKFFQRFHQTARIKSLDGVIMIFGLPQKLESLLKTASAPLLGGQKLLYSRMQKGFQA
jgi:hypothetical protein